ncbi:hypothetical protein S7711_03515 [Stachybotrys chartarum IBT 7711]|uniref:Acyltransferase 3 domain-containing protein n=1 Tax=Stachybotrys chartarum (strain CBS 109288 / IBT 7711) TaxID=1280523 RepID=A0A084AG01_STACB|nr:hypothetical protein S7711_03515 [Stachybotrys chartarum IBT 7711]
MFSVAARSAQKAWVALIQRATHSAHSYMPLPATSSAEICSHERADMPPSQEKPWRSTYYSRLLAVCLFLLPSFVQDLICRDLQNPRRMHPTSWLDGLRGVASLIVFFFHFTDDTHKGLLMSYGVKREGDEAASSPLQLPFVRVIVAGKPMVHIFFVISGFVLAYKPLKQIRANQFEALQDTLSSSIFRRGFRLYLPPLVSIFGIMFLRYYGLIPDKARETLYEQFQEWWEEVEFFLGLVWAWDSPKIPKYDSHLWTIPIEMSFSMLLFIVVIGLSRTKASIRLACIACIASYLLRQGHYAGWEFLAGVFLAEIQIIQDARKATVFEDGSVMPTPGVSPSASSTLAAQTTKLLFRALLIANLIFALYVAGWPNEKWEETPLIAMLLRITPEPYASKGQSWPIFIWYAIGAVQIVLALQQMEPLRRAFNTGLAQYLGDVSYALYICHGPVLKVVHPRVMPYLWEPMGGKKDAGMWGRLAVWVVGLVTLSIPVFWVSDLFMRFVDRKCVSFARWIERKVFTYK